MSGAKSGRMHVAELLWPCIKYSFCDTIRQCKLMRDALDTTHRKTKLIKPHHDAITSRMKWLSDSLPSIRNVSPTRWIVKAEASSMFSLSLDKTLEVFKETEMKDRIQGVAAQIKKLKEGQIHVCLQLKAKK